MGIVRIVPGTVVWTLNILVQAEGSVGYEQLHPAVGFAKDKFHALLLRAVTI